MTVPPTPDRRKRTLRAVQPGDYALTIDALADDLLVAVRDFPRERPYSMDPVRGPAERRLCEAYNRLYSELHDLPQLPQGFPFNDVDPG